MNFEAMDFGIKVCNMVATMAVGVYVWLSNRNRVTNERITALQEHTDIGLATVRTDNAKRVELLEGAMESRLDRHSDQLARLEVHRASAPGPNDLRRLHERIDGFSSDIARLEGKFDGALAGITGQLAGVAHTVDLLNDYLLNKKP